MMIYTLVIRDYFFYDCIGKGDVIMDEVIKLMYDLYISDTYNNHIEEDKEYRCLTERLVQLEEKFKMLLKDCPYYQNEVNQIIDDVFNANASISSIYRYYDFEQGFITGLAIGMKKSGLNNKEDINTILNKLKQIKKI